MAIHVVDGGIQVDEGDVTVSDGKVLVKASGTTIQVDLTDIAGATGNPGWQKLPSGIILQWGSSQIAGRPLVVNFPVTFPAACRAVAATVAHNTTSQQTVHTQETTTTSVTFYPSSSGTGYVHWIAFGA